MFFQKVVTMISSTSVKRPIDKYNTFVKAMSSNQPIEDLVTQLSISQTKRTLNAIINHTNNALTLKAIG